MVGEQDGGTIIEIHLSVNMMRKGALSSGFALGLMSIALLVYRRANSLNIYLVYPPGVWHAGEA